MQFSTFALSALSIGSAFAASTTSSASSSLSTGTSGSVTVHVVKVGNANGTLAYSPNNIKANVGDMVQFQFAPNNHTVTQSTFDQPCQPIAMNSNVTGFYSGFMPVSATSTITPTYTIMIKNTTPLWVYCSQGKHCQLGMTMVINENPTANATRTLANYQALAAKATVNLPGGSVTGGTSGANSTSTSGTNSGNSSPSSSAGSGSGSGSGSSNGAASTSTSGSGAAASMATTTNSMGAKSSSPAMPVRVGSSVEKLGFSGLLAVCLAMFL